MGYDNKISGESRAADAHRASFWGYGAAPSSSYGRPVCTGLPCLQRQIGIREFLNNISGGIRVFSMLYRVQNNSNYF